MPGDLRPAENDLLVHQTRLSMPQLTYLWLCALSVACLIIADITGVKLFSFDLGWVKINHSCGMLTFPVTFLLTDLTNEYFGRRAARRMVYLSFAMGGLVFVVVNAALAMPRWEVGFNVPSGAFEGVFESSRIMYIASLLAYGVGSLADIAVFGWLKRLTGGRMVWLRATGSTVVSQMLDSVVVTFFGLSVGRSLLGGGDPMPLELVPQTAATGYVLKFFIAIGLTPLIYLGRWFLNRRLGLVPLPPGHGA